MNWLFPGLLWAMSILIIPIIIHLFYFRRYKKEVFSDIRLLQELKKETNKFSKLRNLLALLMRLLAITALIFAFAQPFFEKDKHSIKKNIVSIYIDNSFSMSAQYGEVALLDVAKKKAKEVINSYSEQDQFQVITNEMSGGQQFVLDQQTALETVASVKLFKGENSLSSIYQRQREISKKKAARSNIYWIGDFQKSTTDLIFDKSDSSIVSAVLIQDRIERNVSLDTAWFVKPNHLINQNSELIVKIINYSDHEATAVNMTMAFQGQNRPLGNYSLSGNEELLDTISLPITVSGWQELQLSITDYPVNFDDHLFLSFEVKPAYNVLVINTQANPYFSNLFKTQAAIFLEQQLVGALDYSNFEKKDLIILEDLPTVSSGMQGQLLNFVEKGGKLLIFPRANHDIQSMNELISGLKAGTYGKWLNDVQQVKNINAQEFVFRGVFEKMRNNMTLPTSTGRYIIERGASRGQSPIMSYRDGKTYMSRSKYRDGEVYLCATALDKNTQDLVRQGEIFVPMIYNMAIHSFISRNSYFTLGENSQFEWRTEDANNETAFRFIKDNIETIPPQRRLGKKLYLEIGNDFIEEGIFRLKGKNKILDPRIAINYSRKESSLDCYSSTELQEKYGDNIELLDAETKTNLSNIINKKNSGTWLWKYLLMAALLFLLIEVIIIRIK